MGATEVAQAFKIGRASLHVPGPTGHRSLGTPGGTLCLREEVCSTRSAATNEFFGMNLLDPTMA
jgi:hypothetical protein